MKNNRSSRASKDSPFDNQPRPHARGEKDTGRSPSSTPDPKAWSSHAPSSEPAKVGLRGKLRAHLSRSREQPKRLDKLDVVVLYSRPLDNGSWTEHELLADQATEQVAHAVAEAVQPYCHSVQVYGCTWDLLSCLGSLDPDRHLIFNLYEGQIGHPGSEARTARLIEALGFAYTGADHEALSRSNNKWMTKKRLFRAGIPTPPCQLVRQFADWKLKLPPPVIVKPTEEDGSIGITQKAIAHTIQETRVRVEEMRRKFQQAVLIEEFIVGREINVAMWGNQSPVFLPIAEIDFTWTDDPFKKIVSYASKWDEDSPEFSGTPGICPADLTRSEQQAIEQVSTKCWQKLGLKGYARIDMRLREGVPYILEVNANPDLSPSAGFFRSAATAGYTYEEMILHIANLALRGDS